MKEIYIKASPEICSKRDVKGMWKLAKEGKIKDFTGYNAIYEAPENPDLIIDTEIMNVFYSIQMLSEFIGGILWQKDNRLQIRQRRKKTIRFVRFAMSKLNLF